MNRKFILFLIGLFSFMIIGMVCSSDSPNESPMEDTEVAVETDAASNVIISDIGENGNGLDLSVSFDKAVDESKVSEYRIFVIKSASASTFDLATANSVTDENYTRVPKSGENINTILTSDTKDIDGDLLQNGVDYKVHILSIADGTISNINVLSTASNSLTLRFFETSAVTNIIVADISNNGNGSDLRIIFDVPADESSVKEYKVIVVNVNDVSTFNLDAANALNAARVTTIAKTGSNIDIALGENSVDSNGELIVNGKSYNVFVLTVADGVNTSLNALSSPSKSILLGIIEITYLQNDGVLISNGENQILIDAVINPSNLGGWVGLGSTEWTKLLNAQAPYDQIDLILVTHNHGDHFRTSSIVTHLNGNPDTKLVAPPQVLSGFALRSQIINIDVPKFSRDTLTVNNIKIDILSLRHFDAFGNDFSAIQNYGYLINLDGIKVLHLGDVDMTSENFDNFDLANEGIDVVITPTFVQSVHMSITNRDVMLNQINPVNIIATHLLSGSIQSITVQVLAIYPNAIIFETPLESVIF